MIKEKKKELPFNNMILILLFKALIFIIALPLIFIYTPLRYVARQLTKLFSSLLKLFRTYKGDSSFIKKLDKFNKNLIKFFDYVSISHPYTGDNYFIKYLDNHVIGEKVGAQKTRSFIFFLLPALGSFFVFVITPFLMGLYYSFTNWTGLNSGSEIFVGFQNYKTIFTDYLFVYSFIRTTLYSVLNVIVINSVAFGLALLVTQNLKFKNVYRAGFFMPNLIGGLVLGYIWQFVYSAVFPAVGVALGTDTGIFAHSLIGGFASSGEAMGALIGVVTWQYAGYIMMIYIAALQNVPVDLIEASKIDGASAFQRLKSITLPLVAQAFTISLFLTLVTSFKQYDTIFALTQGGPPSLIPEYLANFMNVPTFKIVNSLDLMAINIYDTAFSHYQMGIGQAKAIVFFLILLIVSVGQVTYNQRKEVEL